MPTKAGVVFGATVSYTVGPDFASLGPNSVATMTKHDSGVFSVFDLTGEPPSVERRLDPRLMVDLQVTGEFRGSREPYRVVDISRTGALVERDQLEAPPSLHTMVFDVGAGEPLRLLARTIWTAPHHHAVRFVGQDDLDRLDLAERIDELIAHHAA
jgi:hypothetical protein